MLAMGMGNPLQPGTYYIGVQDPVNVEQLHAAKPGHWLDQLHDSGAGLEFYRGRDQHGV